MSVDRQDRGWGPSHQHIDSPFPRHGHGKLIAGLILVLLVEMISRRASHPDGQDPITSALRTLLFAAAAIIVAWATVRFLLVRWRVRQHTPVSPQPFTPSTPGASHGDVIREHSRRLGGGAFLGLAPGGSWVTADPEHAVLILGPPRSGKTSSVVIPTMLATPGPALCTSTKTDVLDASWHTRAEIGQVWLFDPCTDRARLPSGVRRLCWSPIAGAGTWDQALMMARAMSTARPPGKGASNESHWAERSAALLAPLLYAAHLHDRPITDLLRWVLRADLDAPARILEDHHAELAGDVLAGIARTDERERSSILSATAGILSAYNSDAARQTATDPNFDPTRFANSTDTIFITAPAHRQGLCAPLIVGLLEQIRWAIYQHARDDHDGPPMVWCLDEVANIAPIHDLPALVSEAGGQHLHVIACLQDLSQARTRWGTEAADGFLSLFQSKLILSGIADTKTLQAVSLVLGEYDRRMASKTLARSETQKMFFNDPATHTESVTYQTSRQPTLSPAEISRLPAGHALRLTGTRWGLTRLAPPQTSRPQARIRGS